MTLSLSDTFLIALSLVSVTNICNGVKDNSEELLPEYASDSHRRSREATCNPLNSISRAATCSRFRERVSCQSPILPFTKAKVTCRTKYGPDPIFSAFVEQEVECSPSGTWSPEPITCSPVCGTVYGSGPNQLTEIEVFPWHANIWKEITTRQESEMRFQCSATIVSTKLVITSARCVSSGKAGAPEDPTRLRVTIGNAYRGSNPGQSLPWTLQKVKNVYTYCEDSRQAHDYVSDIALVELLDPFEFSTAVLPACLDVSSYSETDFGPGVSGKVDGFSRNSASSSNPVYQTVEATHVSISDCRASSSGGVAIGSDQFCAVYFNETTDCHRDSGGGFVTKKKGLWHLMGVFIKDLSPQGAETTCRENSYSLYTKVSSYVAWIQDVMFQLAKYETYPPCKIGLPQPVLTTTTTPRPISRIRSASTSSSPYILPTSCLAPSQPVNGRWQLNSNSCNNVNCDVPRDTLMKPGSLIVYSCDFGFSPVGRTDVYCTVLGRWSPIPICVADYQL